MISSIQYPVFKQQHSEAAPSQNNSSRWGAKARGQPEYNGGETLEIASFNYDDSPVQDQKCGKAESKKDDSEYDAVVSN